MENNHKGTEYQNVIETWEQNERNKLNTDPVSKEGSDLTDLGAGNDLEHLIKQEAFEYDHENKENRVLGGDRATINDDDAGGNGSV